MNSTHAVPAEIVAARTTALLSILPLVAAVLSDLLDRGYDLAQALRLGGPRRADLRDAAAVVTELPAR